MTAELAARAKALGNEAFQQGDYLGAIEHYTEAIVGQPNEHTYYSNRSFAYFKLAKYRKALDDAKKCTQLAPDWPKGHYRMGEAYTALGLPARACEAFRISLKLNPKDETVQQALSKAEAEMNKKSIAEDDEDDSSPSRMEKSYQGSFSGSINGGRRPESIPVRRHSIGISSMYDYLKFREAGGAKLPEDPSISTFLTTIPSIRKTSSRGDVLASVGIFKSDEDSYAPSTTYKSMENDVESSGTGEGDSLSNTQTSVISGRGRVSKVIEKGDGYSSTAQDKPHKVATAPVSSTVSSSQPSGKLTGDWAKMFASDTAFAKLQRSDENDSSFDYDDNHDMKGGDKENVKERSRNDEFPYLDQHFQQSSHLNKYGAANSIANNGRGAPEGTSMDLKRGSHHPSKVDPTTYSKVLGVSMPLGSYTSAGSSMSQSQPHNAAETSKTSASRKNRAGSEPTLMFPSMSLQYEGLSNDESSSSHNLTFTSSESHQGKSGEKGSSSSYRELLLNQFRCKTKKVLHDSGTTAMVSSAGGSSHGGDDKYRKPSQSSINNDPLAPLNIRPSKFV